MKKFLLVALFTLILSAPAYAFSGDISISGNPIKISTNTLLEGKSFRIYASVTNNSDKDLLGITRFYLNDKQIGSDQQISIFSKKTDDIFIDYLPTNYGIFTLKTQIFPWDSGIDNPANNTQTKEITILRDTDRDGLANEVDPDDDNDGVKDEDDAFPLNKAESYDTDGDGKGNNADPDDDNDGVPDEFDEMPLDPNESMDTDKDGIGNVKDTDDDNDGLSDAQEENIKTNPLNPDTDGDTVNDKDDAFPLDPTETIDTDNDGIGNNADTDDDNDGLNDDKDQYPLNKGPIIKLANENPTAIINKSKTLDASQSIDLDGLIKEIKWEIDGKTFTGEKIDIKFPFKGEQEIKLTVTDNIGESRSKNFQVSVISLKIYQLIGAITLTLLLALAVFLKYISTTKKSENNK